jgi:hypothetical protein
VYFVEDLGKFFQLKKIVPLYRDLMDLVDSTFNKSSNIEESAKEISVKYSYTEILKEIYEGNI